MARPKQLSDEALLAAAREVFVAAGYGGSTRAIAKRAGVSEAVLFQRHRTKLDLFFAAMVPHPFDPARPARRGPTGVRGFEAIALEAMAYFRGIMPVLMQLVTHPAFSLEQLAARQGDLPLRGLHAAVVGGLEELRRRGAVTAGPQAVAVAALTLVATLHSLALFERMGLHGGAATDEVVRRVARLIVAGLGANEARQAKGGRP